MEPKNDSCQKESPIPRYHFRVNHVKLWKGILWGKCMSQSFSASTKPSAFPPPPPWQGIIGTMRCCVLDNYKRKHNMVPTVIEQDDFILFYDIKWYPQVSLIEKTTHHKTSKSLGDMF